MACFSFGVFVGWFLVGFSECLGLWIVLSALIFVCWDLLIVFASVCCCWFSFGLFVLFAVAGGLVGLIVLWFLGFGFTWYCL